jgi:hypothetical protein
MTFGSRATRTAYHVPLWWLGGLGLMAWLVYHQSRHGERIEWAFLGLVLALLGLKALAGVRQLRAYDGVVVVRSLFRTVSLNATACGFPVVPGRGRGFAVHVFAADGDRRIRVATTYSQAGADYLAGWLGRVLLEERADPAGAGPAQPPTG